MGTWTAIALWALAWAALLGVHWAQKRNWFGRRWLRRACLAVGVAFVGWCAVHFLRGLFGHTHGHVPPLL